MIVRSLAIALLCLVAGAGPAAGVAIAQQDPFGPIPQAPPDTTTTVAPTTSSSNDSGLSGTQELLIGAAGIVLLVGIGWAIVRDARETAPVDADHPLAEPGRAKATRTPPDRRRQVSRSKAKAARQARKRNR